MELSGIGSVALRDKHQSLVCQGLLEAADFVRLELLRRGILTPEAEAGIERHAASVTLEPAPGWVRLELKQEVDRLRKVNDDLICRAAKAAAHSVVVEERLAVAGWCVQTLQQAAGESAPEPTEAQQRIAALEAENARLGEILRDRVPDVIETVTDFIRQGVIQGDELRSLMRFCEQALRAPPAHDEALQRALQQPQRQRMGPGFI